MLGIWSRYTAAAVTRRSSVTSVRGWGTSSLAPKMNTWATLFSMSSLEFFLLSASFGFTLSSEKKFVASKPSVEKASKVQKLYVTLPAAHINLLNSAFRHLNIRKGRSSNNVSSRLLLLYMLLIYKND